MPDQPNHTSSRDFAFQSNPGSDQSFAHHTGEAATASTAAYPAQAHDRYNGENATNGVGAASLSDQAAAQNTPLNYPDFGAHHTLPSHATPGQFATFGASFGAPLLWDWNNSLDFPEFANHYEPQGELVEELRNQTVPSNDFSIPLPITHPDAIYQSPQTTPGLGVAATQNPLSPPPKPPRRPAVQTGMKRKADSEPNSALSQPVSNSGELQQNPAKRHNKSRSSSSASATSPTVAATATDARPSSMTRNTTTTAVAAPDGPSQANMKADNETQRRKEPSKGTGPQGKVIDISKPRKIVESPANHDTLPAGKVFPIQIGSELFRLSGASISSDAPSYFSHYFGEQVHNNAGRAGDVRTLYIDRDPETFREIALHLQGYHIAPRDGEHYVRLYADAQFYSLPRLTRQLFATDIFVRIGGVPFHIPRDLFSGPGDTPNYFTLGFAQFFSSPTEAFPGLDRSSLLRPPSIRPPIIPGRNPEIFAELVKRLQGYKLDIRNEAHRAQLLRDARYFHLRGLEQKLIPCDISFNLKRNQSEILIRFEDIRQSGISFTADPPSSNASSTRHSTPVPPTSKPASPAPPPSSIPSPFRPGAVSYARPYTDDHAHTNILIMEISSTESTTLHLPAYPPKPATASPSSPADLTLNLRATFHANTLARITSLFSVIASKMGLPATQPLGLMMLQSGGGVATQPVSPANSGVSERRVRVRLAADCCVELDGCAVELGVDVESGRLGVRRASGGGGAAEEWLWGGAKPDPVHVTRDGEDVEEEWTVKRAHWRLRVEPVGGEGGGGGAKMQVVLCGVRIEGFAAERARNGGRGFLGSGTA
ncbi:hypothetical protein BDV95DRAFT_487900 [Massariosphaeria phaeospora]|uniref:Potassium channel tetramerisation-type BTB domain-containing protein n=1 Tax=Massariosphaeria phaeospora TaxID=100035 RepID=A0A7C8MD17_9PLEO|nr:hypothetical protein BDV95DRAFT_487900 [Massariosphaeria phaeospora]